MPFKSFELEDLGTVTVYKRRGSRNLRLSVTRKGAIRITITAWAPYQAGVDFVRAKRDWLQNHIPATPSLLQEGMLIGKSHRLHFLSDPTVTAPRSRLHGSQVIISYSPLDNPAAPGVQTVAEQACIRALRQQAKHQLPVRLRALADEYGYHYNSVTIKRLTGRWGSCDQNRDIVLNLFLMQLPWELIDYVLMHELAHTRVLRHGPVFWEEMERYTPHAKRLRKQTHQYQPSLHPEAA